MKRANLWPNAFTNQHTIFESFNNQNEKIETY